MWLWFNRNDMNLLESFCVQRKYNVNGSQNSSGFHHYSKYHLWCFLKESHTGVKRREGEYMTDFSIWVDYRFKKIYNHGFSSLQFFRHRKSSLFWHNQAKEMLFVWCYAATWLQPRACIISDSWTSGKPLFCDSPPSPLGLQLSLWHLWHISTH